MAGKIVVDTSVLIKWIKTKDEELLAEAGRLLRQVESKSLSVHVPALLADRRFFDRTRSLPRVRHLSKIGAL